MESIRYIVKDVDATVAFDAQYLRLAIKMIQFSEMAPRK